METTARERGGWRDATNGNGDQSQISSDKLVEEFRGLSPIDRGKGGGVKPGKRDERNW